MLVVVVVVVVVAMVDYDGGVSCGGHGVGVSVADALSSSLGYTTLNYIYSLTLIHSLTHLFTPSTPITQTLALV